MKKPENRDAIISNNLQEGVGHFLKLTLDNNGLIDSATYLGTEPISIHSLISLIGLSETYLNKLVDRKNSNLIENVTEFLSENWAISLYHEWFSEFRFSLKQKMSEQEGIKSILEELDEDSEAIGFVNRTRQKQNLSKITEQLKMLIRVIIFLF